MRQESWAAITPGWGGEAARDLEVRATRRPVPAPSLSRPGEQWPRAAFPRAHGSQRRGVISVRRERRQAVGAWGPSVQELGLGVSSHLLGLYFSPFCSYSFAKSELILSWTGTTHAQEPLAQTRQGSGCGSDTGRGPVRLLPNGVRTGQSPLRQRVSG